MDAHLENVLGDWKGFLDTLVRIQRVVFKLRLENDQLSLRVDSPDSGIVDAPVENIRFDGKYLRGEITQAVAVFTGVFAGEDLLTGQVEIQGQRFPLELRRDHPGFARYETPRLDEVGRRVQHYTYQVPPRLDDGWETGALKEEGVTEESVAALMDAVLAGEYPQTHSILVARHGRLLLEEYFYGHEREKLHGIQSVTKSINSILIGIAIDRAEIKSVDQMVYEYFPERQGTRWVDGRYAISIKDALMMRAALDWEETLPYTDPRNDNTTMNRSADWVGYILNKRVAGAPGRKYAYTSGLSILLGAVLKNATGFYADEYAEKHLFAPLGITNYSWHKTLDGTRHTGGGLELRARDLLKLGEMMRLGGRWGNIQVVSTDWARISTSQQTARDDYAYGYQWHVRRLSHAGETFEVFCGMGYGGQFVFVFPSLDLVAVFNAGLFDGDTKPFEKLEKYLLPAIVSRG